MSRSEAGGGFGFEYMDYDLVFPKRTPETRRRERRRGRSLLHTAEQANSLKAAGPEELDKKLHGLIENFQDGHRISYDDAVFQVNTAQHDTIAV